MKLDRALQLDLLKRLSDVYPRTISVQSWLNESDNVNPNLHYLLAHGLITGAASNDMSGAKEFVVAEITAAGLDFLADDGGLSAILGVMTVKLHEDTIRQLLIDRVEASNFDQEERSSLVAMIRSLPAKALGTLTEKLLEKGADQMLDGAPKLGTLLVQIATQQFS